MRKFACAAFLLAIVSCSQQAKLDLSAQALEALQQRYGTDIELHYVANGSIKGKAAICGYAGEPQTSMTDRVFVYSDHQLWAEWLSNPAAIPLAQKACPGFAALRLRPKS